MVTLYTKGNWKIAVYTDHNPPHFHVVTPEAEALVSIATIELIKGSVPPKVLRAACEWAVAHKKELWAMWNLLNKRR
jgi:hypothetical protein